MAGLKWKEIRLAGLPATNSPTLDLVPRMKGALRGAEQFCLCLVT